MWHDVRRGVPIFLLAALLCAGCGGEPAAPVATPSPTIAVAAPAATPSPRTTAATRRPTPGQPSPTTMTTGGAGPTAATSTSRLPTPSAEAAPFVYLWPSYLPAGMQVSPAESRVAREGEIGAGGLGFFIVTFAAGTQKLVVGGGATETLPLTGDQRRLIVGGRQATLTTNGDQRQVIFEVAAGSLFVYGFGIGEEELLRVAGSLQPIDVRELRQRVTAQ